ncbi:acyl-CoA thioesterase domain-containing protein [Nocardia otitidiscaviarum]|uniref:acyl-CoA thioesterase domain-containing protein n=1 Tax=Nocardia otitidiscaviarum TaxID=1823 RepID=UPI002457432B|nr:acyl-CoA thioesterase domain-containing protein [Nocardia otitidiscaviarum]
MTTPSDPDGYFVRVADDRYKPTTRASGAWDTNEPHFSPLGGLVVHAMDRHLADRGRITSALSRIGFDIPGRLPLDECNISVEPIRSGRTIELLEATVQIADRPAVRARAWLLARYDTAAVTGDMPDRLPAPESLEWMFPNVDLTVHLYRSAIDRWTGLDTTVTFGPTGQGLTSTVLHDIHGPVGTAQQLLTVRPRR